MIWALLAIYFLGGGMGGSVLTTDAIKAMNKRVDDVIVDSAKAKAIGNDLDSLRAEVKGINKIYSKSGKELTKIYKDHAVGAENMIIVMDQLNVEWDAAQQRAIELRLKLKDSMTAEEWSAIVNGN